MTKEELCCEIAEYVKRMEEKCGTIELSDIEILKKEVLSKYQEGEQIYFLIENIFNIAIKDVYGEE